MTLRPLCCFMKEIGAKKSCEEKYSKILPNDHDDNHADDWHESFDENPRQEILFEKISHNKKS